MKTRISIRFQYEQLLAPSIKVSKSHFETDATHANGQNLITPMDKKHASLREERRHTCNSVKTA